MKKVGKYFLFVGIIFSGLNSICQNSKIDSLLSLLKNVKDDTSKINILNEISEQARSESNFELAVNYAEKAIKLSEKNVFKNGLARAYKNIGKILQVQQKYPESVKNFLSSLQLYKEQNNPSGVVASFSNIGLTYYDQSKYDSALYYFFKELEYSQSLNYTKGLARGYGDIALVYKDQLKYKESLEYTFKALKICDELGDKTEAARHCINIGRIYYNQGNYPNTLMYFLKSLRINELENKRYSTAKCLALIGVVYKTQGDFKRAEEYYSRSLDIYEEYNDRKSIADLCGNIGVAIEKQGEKQSTVKMQTELFEKARTFLYKSLKIYEEIKDLGGIATQTGNIGLTYDGQGDDKNALLYYLKALGLTNKERNKKSFARHLGNIGFIYARIKKKREARKYLIEALSLSTKTGETELIQSHHYYLSFLDSVCGNYKSALEHYKIFITIKDSLLSEENAKKQTQLEMQYDFDKKQAADSIRNTESKKLAEMKYGAEIKNQKLLTYGGVSGFLVMIIVAGISFRAFKNKQRANILIEHQKLLVEEKQKEILDSIHYAKRIQTALITNEKYIDKTLNNLNSNNF